MTDDVYEVLRRFVTEAIGDWAQWLETDGDADDFRAIFSVDPHLELMEGEGSSVWSFRLAEEAQGPLGLRLHRERDDRRAREQEAAMEAKAREVKT